MQRAVERLRLQYGLLPEITEHFTQFVDNEECIPITTPKVGLRQRLMWRVRRTVWGCRERLAQKIAPYEVHDEWYWRDIIEEEDSDY